MPSNSGLQILEIEVTNRCNLNCKHCYVDKTSLRTITSEEMYKLIDLASKMKVYRVIFTGGEPLLIDKIFDYAKYAKKKKIPEIVLLTNGLLINDKNISNLKLFNFVQLSIDAPPKEKPSFRPDYLSRLEKSIDLLVRSEIKVHLQATLCKGSIKKIEPLVKFAKKKKVTIGFNNLVLIGNANELVDKKLNPDELKKALEKIVSLKKENKFIQCSDPKLFLVDCERMAYFQSLKSKNILGGCIAGVATLYIKSNGDVQICPFVNYTIANVFQERLDDIWMKNSILNKLRDRDNIEGPCNKCAYRSFCGGCRGSSLKSSKSLFGSDEGCWLNKKK